MDLIANLHLMRINSSGPLDSFSAPEVCPKRSDPGLVAEQRRVVVRGPPLTKLATRGGPQRECSYDRKMVDPT